MVVSASYSSLWFGLASERLAADGEQFVEGAAEADGEPDQLLEQPDLHPAASHQLVTGAELVAAHSDRQTTGEIKHVF